MRRNDDDVVNEIVAELWKDRGMIASEKEGMQTTLFEAEKKRLVSQCPLNTNVIQIMMMIMLDAAVVWK